MFCIHEKTSAQKCFNGHNGQLPFNIFPSNAGFNLGTAQVINYAHAHDIAVGYWTVNREEDAAYLMSIGADAIITDYPDMVYRVRESGN